jgi:hypothetical protein
MFGSSKIFKTKLKHNLRLIIYGEPLSHLR